MTYKPDHKTLERLKALSTLKHLPLEELMHLAVIRYLEEEEGKDVTAVLQDRWSAYERTGESVPHSDVEKWMSERNNGIDAPCPNSQTPYK